MNKVTRKAKKIRILLCMIVSILLGGGAFNLQAQAAGRTVAIEACQIAGDQVICNLKASQVPASDDGLYYIYSNEVFQDGPKGVVAATGATGAEVTIEFPLQYNTPQSHLSRKFLVAVKKN